MIIRNAGYLMLGSRFKRLGDRALAEVRAVYSAANVPFETSWFPLFYVLQKTLSCSIQELSAHLNVSHSAVSQLVSQMEKRGLIGVFVTAEDQRRKEIRLTARGNALMKQVAPIWEAFEMAFKEHMSEDLLPLLDTVEEKLSSGMISQSAIRLLHAEDAIEVTSISITLPVVKAFLSRHKVHTDKHSACAAVFQKDALVGLVVYTVQEEEVTVKDIFIDPVYRRRGHARTLLQWLIHNQEEKPLRIEQINEPLIAVLSGLHHPFSVHPTPVQ